MESLIVLFIASLIVNGIILLILFYLYQSQKRVLDITPFIKKLDSIRLETVGKEKRLLNEAEKESERVVGETLSELGKIAEIGEDTKNKLEQEAKKRVAEDISKDSLIFQNTIKDITESYRKQLESVSTIQKEEYVKILASAKDSINKELQNMRQEILSTAEEQRKKAQEEVRVYKDGLKSDLDQRIYSIISDVAKETIGESIDISKHEELVLQALKRAKNERFL